jgi:4-amino-4-deoxy-L-arabinose transferase-like glycosyltransferase
MSTRRQRGWLLLILLAAAVLRWTGLDWDEYLHYHPDERYIAWVATTIEWPDDWRTALRPSQSSFNPFYWPPDAASAGIETPQDAPRKYAYGHLPLYLGVAATRLVERVSPALRPLLPEGWLLTRDILNGRGAVEFRHLTAVARALTGLVDLGTLLALFLLGRRVFGPAVGLLAAAFLAVNVMHVQLAHFFTADPYLTFFTVTAVYFMVRAVAQERPNVIRSPRANLVAAAIFVGLAVGSKFAAVLLFLPLALTLWLAARDRFVGWLAVTAVIAFLIFFLTNPFAVLDLSCDVPTTAARVGPLALPAFNLRSCYLQNVITQGAMVRGESDLAFTRQYAGTWPYLYFIEMQLRWGMGWLLGALAFAGLAFFTLHTARQAWRRAPLEPAILILLAWSLPFFLTTGGFFVKFMRYLQPLTPFLMLFGAALLWRWPSRRGRWAAGLVLGVTAVYALSFVSLYRDPHPWAAASRWIYANIPQGALLVSEQWDDTLPSSLPVDGELRRRWEYRDEQLTWLTRPDAGDDLAKLEENLALLARADYVTVVSNRVYGVVPRQPERYPLSSQYHQLLFDGALGYELVYANTRAPNLFGFHLKPDPFGWAGVAPPGGGGYLADLPGVSGGRFDESFTVYDQPLVMIFENAARKSPAELLALFELPGEE